VGPCEGAIEDCSLQLGVGSEVANEYPELETVVDSDAGTMMLAELDDGEIGTCVGAVKVLARRSMCSIQRLEPARKYLHSVSPQTTPLHWSSE
jgi:hypothetical protein